MTVYTYTNDYEQQWCEKYEGTYTEEEIELNKKLYKECTKKNVDFTAIEFLLQQGADPLGGTRVCGWDLLNHIYGEIISDLCDSDSVHLPRITELFLKYGMNVDAPRIPYDDNSLNPMWMLSFAANENSILSLKYLLDYGLSAEAFAEFWGHSTFDFFNIECGDPQKDTFWNSVCVWTLKMILLGASYDHILESDEDLREFICCDYNSNDVHIFREWNDFDYAFDTSYCYKGPELYNSIVHITSRDTGDEVWRIGIGAGGRKLLEESNNLPKREHES